MAFIDGGCLTNKKAKGQRAKTRDKLKRKGSKLSVNKILKEFNAAGETVQVNINSSFHSGIPHRRYQGISGKVIGRQGNAFKIAVKEGNAPRTLIVTAAHLKVLQHSGKGEVQ